MICKTQDGGNNDSSGYPNDMLCICFRRIVGCVGTRRFTGIETFETGPHDAREVGFDHA
jgi:hypothetical protein